MFLSFLVCALSLMGLSAVPKIVFDADMAGGRDDVDAVACLHALADAGKCEILALATCTDDQRSLAAMRDVTARYGRGNLPVGRASDADAVYRRALASAPDGSVVFCSIGSSSNVCRLLETKGDGISPLDGRALVAKKVREWHVMSARVSKGPVPIVVSGWKKATVLSAVYGAKHFFDTERRVYTRRHVDGIFDELIAREPLCRRTDEAITTFRRGKLERTATGVRMLRDGKTLWNLEIDNPEGRPFFHPLMLPGGRPLTDLRPKDHVWHLGSWFSWKFVNGVNYWEPADAKRQGAEPAGRTRVTWKRVTLNGLDCVAEMTLEYGPRAEKDPVLAENRYVTIDPPDAKGGYVISVRHRFKALKDAVLDRTPPHGDVKKGRWGGGYAGATLRLDPAFAKVADVRGFAGGDTPAACTGVETKFLDFTDPATGEGVTFTQLAAPASARFYLWPDKRMINPSPVYAAPLTLKKGETLELAYRLAVHASRQPVTGPEPKTRPVERMDRGLVASVSPRGTYVRWRLLDDEPADVPFDLWRRVDGKVGKVNAEPIVQTSDCFIPAFTNATAEYSLDGKTFTPVRCEKDAPVPFVRIPLADTNATVAAVAVGDLDGDGAYDYVVKTPSGGTDPWDLVWKPAKDTCKLEAYTSAGKFLWRIDLGWNIETGIWYAPFVVADLDGDGKAEVIAKTAPRSPDYRDPDGRVMAGPEYLTVLDGMTGEVRAQTDWIPRGAPDPVDDYNHFNSRNQIALACLDGRTPCVIMSAARTAR